MNSKTDDNLNGKLYWEEHDHWHYASVHGGCKHVGRARKVDCSRWEAEVIQPGNRSAIRAESKFAAEEYIADIYEPDAGDGVIPDPDRQHEIALESFANQLAEDPEVADKKTTPDWIRRETPNLRHIVGLRAVVEAGKLLNEAKERLPRGKFGWWLDIVGVSERTARNYRDAAKYFGGDEDIHDRIQPRAAYRLCGKNDWQTAAAAEAREMARAGVFITFKLAEELLDKHRPEEPEKPDESEKTVDVTAAGSPGAPDPVPEREPADSDQQHDEPEDDQQADDVADDDLPTTKPELRVVEAPDDDRVDVEALLKSISTVTSEMRLRQQACGCAARGRGCRRLPRSAQASAGSAGRADGHAGVHAGRRCRQCAPVGVIRSRIPVSPATAPGFWVSGG